MAKKKTSKAVAKRGSTAISTNVNDFYSEYAEEESQRGSVGGTSNFVALKAGKFEFQGSDLGKELEVVILNFADLNEYYEGDYDPDNVTRPDCFSLSLKGPKGEDMIPHENSPTPQDDFCKDCWANQFSSGKIGKSKACGNKNRIALVDSGVLNDPKEAEIVFMRLGVNSKLNFDKYKKGMNKIHNRPIFGVVTKITFDEDEDNPILVFDLVETVEDVEVAQALAGMQGAVEEDLMTPYTYDGVDNEEPAPTRGGKKKVVKKKTAKKKAAKKKSAKKKGRTSKFNR